MSIFIERTITINNDKATLDKPIYFYIGDGNITCLFTIKEKEKTARFGRDDNSNNVIDDNEDISYGDAYLYKPNKDHRVAARTQVIGNKLQVDFMFDDIDDPAEAGVHQLQIRLYDSPEGQERNRLTIPPVDIHVLMPIGTDTNAADEAIVDYSLLDRAGEDVSTFDEEGNYNKTEWIKGDIITSNKLNKIEDALYEINAADSNFVTAEALEAELRGKTDVGHKHTTANITGLHRVATSGSYNDLSNKPSFATKTELANHDHDDAYAAKNHTHDGYGEYDDNHNHDDAYAAKNHTHDGVYAPNNHNHDIEYAASGHNHDDEYAASGHNHNDIYAPNGHNHDIKYASNNHHHDDKYAASGHNHDDEYASTSHNHNDEYMTKTELEGRFATKDYVIEYVDQKIGENSGSGNPSTGGESNIDDESISKYTVYSSSKVYDLVTQLSAVDTQLEDDLGDMDTRLDYVEREISAIKDNSQNPSSGNLDNYYTKDETYNRDEIDTKFIYKADKTHYHDDLYVRKEDMPTNISAFANDAGYITSNMITEIRIVDELPDEEEDGVLYIVKG